MTADEFRTVMKSEPFRPFEFRLADGRTYTVNHPDFLMVAPGPRSRSAVYFESDGEKMHVIDLALVSEIVASVPVEGEI